MTNVLGDDEVKFQNTNLSAMREYIYTVVENLTEFGKLLSEFLKKHSQPEENPQLFNNRDWRRNSTYIRMHLHTKSEILNYSSIKGLRLEPPDGCC